MADEPIASEDQAPKPVLTGRNKNGQFAPGVCGNPKGRPSNPHSGFLRARHLLNEALPELAQQVIALARAGDFPALTLCLERCIPFAKDEPITFRMGAVNSLDDIGKSLSDIVASVASGELTPSEGSSVAG